MPFSAEREDAKVRREARSNTVPFCIANLHIDWTPFQPYMILAYSVARISSLVMVGPELCRNEEWLNMAVSTTMAVFAGAQTIRQKYSPQWRWLASYFDPGSKLAYAGRKRAGELLRPVYEKRRADAARGKKSLDAIQWLINASPNGKKNMVDLADDQLFLTLAAIHTTSASILSTVYDLLDRPDSIAEILEEIHTVKAELQSDHWTKQALVKLEKLDSFMKESQRVNPIGLGAPISCFPFLTLESDIHSPNFSRSHCPALSRQILHLQGRFPYPRLHADLFHELRAQPRRRRPSRPGNLRSAPFPQNAQRKRHGKEQAPLCLRIQPVHQFRRRLPRLSRSLAGRCRDEVGLD